MLRSLAHFGDDDDDDDDDSITKDNSNNLNPFHSLVAITHH